VTLFKNIFAAMTSFCPTTTNLEVRFIHVMNHVWVYAHFLRRPHCPDVPMVVHVFPLPSTAFETLSTRVSSINSADGGKVPNGLKHVKWEFVVWTQFLFLKVLKRCWCVYLCSELTVFLLFPSAVIKEGCCHIGRLCYVITHEEI
jgi:hypothetical protein